jgi:hypothetical protein
LGIEIFSQSLDIRRQRDAKEMEIDILCLGKYEDGKEIVIVSEVKSQFSSQDIDEFLKELDLFKSFFYEYKEMEIIGVVAGVRFCRGVKRYAERSGLYMLGPSGEVMQLLNSPGFRPRIWR